MELTQSGTHAELNIQGGIYRVGYTGWNIQGGIYRVVYKQSGRGIERWDSHGVGYSWSGTYTEWDTQNGIYTEWDTE